MSVRFLPLPMASMASALVGSGRVALDLPQGLMTGYCRYLFLGLAALGQPSHRRFSQAMGTHLVGSPASLIAALIICDTPARVIASVFIADKGQTFSGDRPSWPALTPEQ